MLQRNQRPRKVNEASSALLRRGMRLARLTQAHVAQITGLKAQTIWRNTDGRTKPSSAVLSAVAHHVKAFDPDLAAKLYAAAGVNEAPMVDPTAHFVDAIVCAAATAMDVSPKIARPGLVAALMKAREVGLSIDVILARLVP